MKNFFSFPRIISYVLVLIIGILAYYTPSLFQSFGLNQTLYYFALFFVVVGVMAILSSLIYNMITKNRGYTLSSLGFVMVILGMYIGLIVATTNNVILDAAQNLYIGVLIMLMLEYILIITAEYRIWLRILLLLIIVLQLLLLSGSMVSIAGELELDKSIPYVLIQIVIHILILTTITPKAKL